MKWECRNSWYRSAGRYAVRAVDPILSKNTKSGKLNDRVWQKALRNKERGQKAQLRLWMVLSELVLSAMQASNLFQSSFYKSSAISSMTLPSSPCHIWSDFSSSPLVPYFSWNLLFFSSAPISLLVPLSNHPSISTANRVEYPIFSEGHLFSSFLLLFWGRGDERFWHYFSSNYQSCQLASSFPPSFKHSQE